MTARKANVSGQYTDGQRPNTLRPWELERAAGHGDSGKPLPDVLCEKHRQQRSHSSPTTLTSPRCFLNVLPWCFGSEQQRQVAASARAEQGAQSENAWKPRPSGNGEEGTNPCGHGSSRRKPYKQRAAAFLRGRRRAAGKDICSKIVELTDGVRPAPGGVKVCLVKNDRRGQQTLCFHCENGACDPFECRL